MFSKKIFNKSSILATTALTSSSFFAFCEQSTPKISQENLKKQVGYKSVDDYVSSDMVVGLGTGSTAYYAVERLGNKLKSGELTNIICIPTSEKTKDHALSLNIPLVELNDLLEVNKGSNEKKLIDVTIDGADEVSSNFTLIKGGGAALLREKLIENASKKFIVIVDDSKLVKNLGKKFPIPIEITPFQYKYTKFLLENLSTYKIKSASFRLKDKQTVAQLDEEKKNGNNSIKDEDYLLVTDNGNYIVDLQFDEEILCPHKLVRELNQICGVVEHGIFVDMADRVIVATKDGQVKDSNKNEVWW